MQKIKSVIESNEQKTLSGICANQTEESQKIHAVTSSPSQEASISLKQIDGMFLQFAAFYGHIWRSQFKQEEFALLMRKEWHEALAHFSPRVLKMAVNSCRDSEKLPPTLPHFVEICKDIRRRDAFIKAVSKSESKITQVAAENLLQIKAQLISPTPSFITINKSKEQTC